jgi:hypothetical protein
VVKLLMGTGKCQRRDACKPSAASKGFFSEEGYTNEHDE